MKQNSGEDEGKEKEEEEEEGKTDERNLKTMNEKKDKLKWRNKYTIKVDKGEI